MNSTSRLCGGAALSLMALEAVSDDVFRMAFLWDRRFKTGMETRVEEQGARWDARGRGPGAAAYRASPRDRIPRAADNERKKAAG